MGPYSWAPNILAVYPLKTTAWADDRALVVHGVQGSSFEVLGV